MDESLTPKHEHATDLSTLDASQPSPPEAAYRAIADTLQCGLWILDSGYHILYSNPFLMHILGYSPADLVGKRLGELLVHKDDISHLLLDQHLEWQKPFEAAFRHLDGRSVWCKMSLSPLLHPDGSPMAILGQIEAVITQKDDDVPAPDIYMHFLKLFAQFPKTGVMVFDTDLRFSNIYGDFYRPGVTPADIEGQLVWNVFPDLAAEIVTSMRQALSGEIVARDIQFRERFHWLVFAPQQRMDGQITHGVILIQNQTGDKFAEDSLRESERLYRIIFDTFFDGLIITVEGVIVDVNPAVERMTGYKQGELVGRLPESIVPAEWLATVQDSIQKHNSLLVESALRRKDGSVFSIEIQTTTIPYKGQVARLTAICDITERKEADKQIRLLATVVRDSKAFIALSNLDGRLIYLNPYGLQLVGLASGDQMSLSHLNVLDFFDQPAQTIQMWQDQIAEMGSVLCEDHLKSRDGLLIPVERVINGVYDDQQRPIAIAVIANDIRERQQLEIERLQSQRIQIDLEKANELRQHKDFFLSVVSHELRTPLAVIRTSADILHSHYGRLSPEKRETNFERILSHIDKLNDMVSDVLLLSRSEMNRIEFLPRPCELDSICQQLVATVARAHPQAEVRYLSQLQKPLFRIDPYLVEHILSNLLNNAAKYSPQDGLASLHVSQTDKGLRFEVQDNGIGIPAEDLEYIFDPFHRASNVGKIIGTGMGLAIVKRFVDLHGGSIDYRSEVGAGTTFTVTIPEEASYDADSRD